MSIYKEQLNELGTFEILISDFEIKNINYYHQKIREFLKNNLPANEKLIQNGYDAIYSYCKCDREYVLHKINQYYAINQIIDEFEPREISETTILFNENGYKAYEQIKIKIVIK